MRIFKIFIFFSFINLYSQEEIKDKIYDASFFTTNDSLYREDQFYFAITYNTLIKAPSDFRQSKIPLGLHVGFMRDMPINKSRTTAVALGIGVSYNKYHHNLLIESQEGLRNYDILEKEGFSKNKLELLYIDVPLELRWRTSTPESHKFFRLHAGFKISYLAMSKSKYVGDRGAAVLYGNSDLSKFQMGPTVAFGYNTWNFYGYYGLNSLFKNTDVDQENIQMKSFHLGLIFYIL